jgi:hypothetical protein
VARRLRPSVVVVDTSALYALVDSAEPAHQNCVDALDGLAGAFLAVSPFVLAEADYLVATRLGTQAELALLRDVERNAYRLVDWGPAEIGACLPIIERYRDLGIGLADASNVVVADRLRTRRIFTLDRRHFDALRPLSGGRFDLVP